MVGELEKIYREMGIKLLIDLHLIMYNPFVLQYLFNKKNADLTFKSEVIELQNKLICSIKQNIKIIWILIWNIPFNIMN